MSNSPFFSIITASLNKAATLRNMLDSVMHQTFDGFEHIVVDGKSSDTTVDILSDYQNKYRLSWISEPDGGIAEAMNKGLKMARGQYIMVLQADDRLLHDNVLKTAFTRMSDEFFDIYSFPVILDHPVDGRVLRAPIRRCWWNRYKFIFLHQGAFVHRRVFEKIGGFREHFSIAMDYDFFYRALNSGCSVEFANSPVALMGGDGVGSRTDTMIKRLREERLVQLENERSAFWRMTQAIFYQLYFPCKIHLLSKFYGLSRRRRMWVART